MASESWHVVRGSSADLPRLEPLWLAVHHAHAESMPELAPYVTDAESWAEHRALYESVLERPDTVLLLALEEESLIGYALAHVLPATQTLFADTWQTGARVAEIETLSVLAERRGEGIGTALMDALEAALTEEGIEDFFVGALAGNEGALRLYRSRGYRPTWMYLSRFRGR